jgi:hypothetical protein
MIASKYARRKLVFYGKRYDGKRYRRLVNGWERRQKVNRLIGSAPKG